MQIIQLLTLELTAKELLSMEVFQHQELIAMPQANVISHGRLTSLLPLWKYLSMIPFLVCGELLDRSALYPRQKSNRLLLQRPLRPQETLRLTPEVLQQSPGLIFLEVLQK